jgi:drug/metabolite transporter (DMT)-like permease
VRAILYGLLASCFFSTAFIFNRAMQLDGASWLWSSALRFFWMAPILFLIVLARGQLVHSLRHLKQHASSYLIWSTVGFGLFYAPLTFASIYSPGWLVAGSWQITLIAGSLLIPFLGHGRNIKQRIPWRSLKWSLVILFGVLLILFDQMSNISWQLALAGFIPVLLAAFMYPLGNRKMMQVCHDQIETPERVFNMTLASLPFWCVLALIGGFEHGLPSHSQLFYSFLVALFSGVIATLLFFSATNMVKHNASQLAIVEATQAGEVLSTLVGEMLFLGIHLPSSSALVGICLIMVGMIVHSIHSVRIQNTKTSSA